MPDLQEAQQIAESLALTTATAVATAMGTDSWPAVRGLLARVFHRRGHDLAEMERRLDADATLVVGEEAAQARSELVPPLRRQLLALLREDPQAADELRELIDRVRAELPDTTNWTQNVTASDHAIVNAVQGGDQHNRFMDRREDREAGGAGA
ncbi:MULTISPECIES: hypothetical protein [Kitasatospora]|uniref:hypothetical protein n=1 Tax=Kitasatospora TaxID=2063 RepID=UPI00369EDAC1